MRVLEPSPADLAATERAVRPPGRRRAIGDCVQAAAFRLYYRSVVARLTSSSWVERVGIGLALALVAGIYFWASHYRLDPLDEGYFIYTSSRVYAGELPYRDFSTPYTPAFFYLNALLFRVFGLDILTLRYSLVVARVAIFLLVYLLGRRIMPPAFAILPIAILLAEDQMPGVWESHPAWWATLGFLAAVWLVCRYRERGGLGWWLAAAACAAASYAFKQNLGIFALAALGAVAAVEIRDLPPLAGPAWLGRLLGWLPTRLVNLLVAAVGPTVLLVLCLGMTWVMRPHLDGVLFVMFALPFGALALVELPAAWRSVGTAEPACRRAELEGFVMRCVLLVGTFLLLTAPWLVALTLALGPRETPFGAFLGAIDTAGYYYALEALRPGLPPLLGLVALAWLMAWVATRRWSALLKVGMGLGALALAAGCVRRLLETATEVHPRLLRAAVLLSVDGLQNLILYLPIPAFFGALVLLARGRLMDAEAGTLRWVLLAGSLLLLNQYPRIDEVHLVFAGPLLWIAGAYGLWRLYLWAVADQRWARGGYPARATAYLALVALPLAATWPSLEGRREDSLHRQQGALLKLGTPTYYPIRVKGANVLEMDVFSWKYEQLALYFEANSRPGERIFVFPAAPLLYYLVDRPNATRFNHIFPGLLTPDDELETIERLAAAPAEWVIWDSFGETYWLKRGDYQRLIDYVWDAYEPVESIGGYEVMRRRTDVATAGQAGPTAGAP